MTLPVHIAVMDYLSGPVNPAAQPSKDPGGNDLPYGGKLNINGKKMSL